MNLYLKIVLVLLLALFTYSCEQRNKKPCLKKEIMILDEVVYFGVEHQECIIVLEGLRNALRMSGKTVPSMQINGTGFDGVFVTLISKNWKVSEVLDKVAEATGVNYFVKNGRVYYGYPEDLFNSYERGPELEEDKNVKWE